MTSTEVAGVCYPLDDVDPFIDFYTTQLGIPWAANPYQPLPKSPRATEAVAVPAHTDWGMSRDIRQHTRTRGLQPNRRDESAVQRSRASHRLTYLSQCVVKGPGGQQILLLANR
jgi:hypothetical protein